MSRLARVALCGALAGAINACLCIVWPPESWDSLHMTWRLVPPGAFHGGLLAAAAFSLGTALAGRSVLLRLAAALPLGWLVGYASWIPLDRVVFDNDWAASIGWAFGGGLVEAAAVPFEFFGFVALFYYLAVAFLLVGARSLRRHVGLGCAAGIAGSLWVWGLAGAWYSSVLHGAVWGTLVGIGAWSGRRKAEAA